MAIRLDQSLHLLHCMDDQLLLVVPTNNLNQEDQMRIKVITKHRIHDDHDHHGYLHTNGAALSTYGGVASHPVEKIGTNGVAGETCLVLRGLPVTRLIMMVMMWVLMWMMMMKMILMRIMMMMMS